MENRNNQNYQNHSNARGRPPKKPYDPDLLMQELIDTVAEVYQATNEIKATAVELDVKAEAFCLKTAGPNYPVCSGK